MFCFVGFFTLILNNCVKQEIAMLEKWETKNTVRVRGTSRERIFVEQLSNILTRKTSKYGRSFQGVLSDCRPDSQDQVNFQGDMFHTVSQCFTLQMSTITLLSSSTNGDNFLWSSMSVNHSVSEQAFILHISWPNRSQIVHIFASPERSQYLGVKERNDLNRFQWKISKEGRKFQAGPS